MSSGKPDNFQTPAHALDPLLPYLKAGWKIWEPSSGKGKMALVLESNGFEVITGDREDGFLNQRPKRFDAIVTNPPYSIKGQFIARCYDLRTPFALLLPITVFDSQERRRMFHQHGVEIIFPSARINYETPNHEARTKEGKKSSAWFYSVWVTWGLGLPAPMVFTGCEPQTSLLEQV
jgi:hypothetical protein